MTARVTLSQSRKNRDLFGLPVADRTGMYSRLCSAFFVQTKDRKLEELNYDMKSELLQA
jgi:hypothetical protein